ncbi:MAG: cupin domain-containing protein [bacterium]
MEVKKESQISEERKDELGVAAWSPWGKEESRFDWSYSSTETGYITEGAVTIHLPGGESISARAGDLIQLPEGLSCEWEITEDLQKGFTFDEVELDADETVEV